MSPVVLEDLLECVSVPGEQRAPAPPLSFREIGYGYRPGQELVFSVVAHLLVGLVIVLSARLAYFKPMVVVARRQIEPGSSVGILYLPTLGGGSEGSGLAGGAEGNAGKISAGLRAQSRRGFAYPGPQPMVSNPPRATLGIQTILQPSLPNLPLSQRFVPLPNLVQAPPPPADPGPPKPVMVVKSGTLALRPTEPTIAAPKIVLPVAPNSRISALAQSKPSLPQKATPERVDISDIQDTGRDRKGLLILNAIPPPPELQSKIPAAEARSLFAVSPAEVTVIADPSAGTKAGGQSSSAAGNGRSADIARGDALAEAATGGEKIGAPSGASGTGTGGRHGNSQGSGISSEGVGPGTGRGVSAGSGIGTGASAPGTGSGGGAGSAPGTGGFRGITIQGGRYGNGNSGSLVANSAGHRQTSYEMTIVSTSNGGGGLPDVGVFHNEKVYTVYLDMRTSDEDPAPSWILQYSVLQPTGTGPGGEAGRILGTPTPPYATLKQIPEFAPELVRRFGAQLIIASAVMNTRGNLEQVSVVQSPEPELIGPVVEALQHWMFQPAQIDGQPVALKILLGIRFAHSR